MVIKAAARGVDFSAPEDFLDPRVLRSYRDSWTVRLANVVGRDRVMGGTDCGFAQGAFVHRVHEEIQWAKLASLVEGARIASRELWGVKAEA